MLLFAAHPHHIYHFSVVVLSVACMHHCYFLYAEYPGHAVALLVEHCTTSRKVAGSILDGFIGIFH
jgi:hypothetical protein